VSADSVNHPTHYGGDTAYEAIKVIEAWKLGFCLGNTVKYIARAERKGAALEDLKKALWYLEREISNREQDLQIAEKVTRHHQTTDQNLRLRAMQEMPQPNRQGEILEEMGEQSSIESDKLASNG